MNSTGLIHLYTSGCDVAPNPFEVHAASSDISIEILDDQVGELNDDEVLPEEPAFFFVE